MGDWLFIMNTDALIAVIGTLFGAVIGGCLTIYAFKNTLLKSQEAFLASQGYQSRNDLYLSLSALLTSSSFETMRRGVFQTQQMITGNTYRKGFLLTDGAYSGEFFESFYELYNDKLSRIKLYGSREINRLLVDFGKQLFRINETEEEILSIEHSIIPKDAEMRRLLEDYQNFDVAFLENLNLSLIEQMRKELAILD